MKKVLLLLLLVFLSSCKEDKSEIKRSTEKKELSSSDTIASYEIKRTLDSVIAFDTLRKLKILDRVAITPLKKKGEKNGSETVLLRFDFYNKIGLVKSVSANLFTEGEGGDWYLYENAIAENEKGKTDERFFELSYGYPACGYIHTHFLFFMESNKIQLVTKHESMVDGIYGHWTQFEPQFSENKIISFTSSEITVGSDESKPYNDDDENLEKTFSDSIRYTYNSNEWISKRITPKGKVYRTEFKSFNELNTQE